MTSEEKQILSWDYFMYMREDLRVEDDLTLQDQKKPPEQSVVYFHSRETQK